MHESCATLPVRRCSQGGSLSRAPLDPVATSTPRSAGPDTAVPAATLAELLVLADRADLWASIAPGIGHDLANALMSLSLPGDHPRTRGAAQSRIERAHRVLNGMTEGHRALPLPIRDLFEDVLAWHRMQLQLPGCDVGVAVEPDLAGVGDARLHHAILALVTAAKEAGATVLELRARGQGNDVVVEIEADVAPAPAESRRDLVVRHLLAGIGARLEVFAGEASGVWRLTLPAFPAAASACAG